MLRRVFIAGVAATGALSSFSLRTNAQQPAASRARIGVLIYGSLERNPNTQALLEGLRQDGAMSTAKTSPSSTGMLRGGRSDFPPSPRISSEQARCDYCPGWRCYSTCYESDAVYSPRLRHECRSGSARHCQESGRAWGQFTGVTFLSDHLTASGSKSSRKPHPDFARCALRDPSHRDNEFPVAERAAKSLKLGLVPVELHDPCSLTRL